MDRRQVVTLQPGATPGIASQDRSRSQGLGNQAAGDAFVRARPANAVVAAASGKDCSRVRIVVRVTRLHILTCRQATCTTMRTGHKETPGSFGAPEMPGGGRRIPRASPAEAIAENELARPLHN